ncbi:DUF3854 domain-containing protein [Nostoc sp. UIC 10630]|uniref:DUF3854 domain-containing protein n=1 Tax=Nostoc sp. UIC 10630 TaxID=2100146 RepID=UPI0013D11E0E|nr:DUF3854 domain-containing protein [Nostoc sp. UIC 10630]NEU81006.1 DUF3854 domain-containing protein [Nostoc sp. UIC 10630]
MFDERHLQLSSAYAKSSEYFARAVIAPYLKFVLDSIGLAIDDEINKRLKLSIGQEAYVMTPDENGGWKWQKFDPQTEESIQAEFEEIEKLLTELLTPLLPFDDEFPLLPPDNTDPLLPGSNTPPKLSPSDSPPILPPSGTPPFLPNSATPVELVVIPSVQEADSTIWAGVAEEQGSRGAEEYRSREEEEQRSEEGICTSFLPPAQKPPSPVPLCPSAPLPLLTSRIDPNHWQELVEESAIAPEIVELNFKSLHLDPIELEHEAWEYLMYSKNLERINTGRLSTGMLNKYSHLEDGGWWCNAGVDPRSFSANEPGDKPAQKIWGCYKPNNPREKADNRGKFIKYEHPPKVELSIFLLDVPQDIAQQIYSKAGVEPSISDRKSGFWYCVWKHNVPVTLAEGAKKAASLLSQGEAAIGLPGIYAGYRSKDGLGNQIVPILHDELAVFATPNRDIKICFDYETRYKTKRNIDIATYRTGQLLSDAGAQVSIVELPGPEKGVDDLIVAQGASALRQVFIASVPLNDWWEKNQPPDLRLTVFLKNGEQIHLYEQLGDGTVNLNPSRESVEEEQTIALFGKTRSSSKLSIIQPTDLITTPESSSQNIGGQVIDAEVLADESKEKVAPAQNASLPLKEVSVHSFDSWARREQVKQYQQNFFRKRLEARENKEIASVAYALVKNYGVEKDGNLVYQADAFTIIKSGNNYSIHRRADETLALMQFYADKWGAITLSEQPKDMFPIERQEFLLVADYLKSGKQLPSVDEDPRKIANTLGSLSLNGTHTILESFKTSEILQILTQTLKRTGCDDLELGNYRILYQKSQLDTTSTLQLLKTEHTGVTRVAASFEFSRTDSGMTHQLKTLAITEQDLAKLRLLAQKLDIQQPAKEATANPHATRDMEVPIHPKIAKLWQDLENRQQKSNSVPYTAAQVEQNSLSPDSTFDLASNSQDINLQPANTAVAKPIKKISTFQHQLSKSDIESIPLPLHPLLGQYWQELEDNHRWADIAKQENAEFRLKIQSNGKLSIGEQRELYNKLLIHSVVEQSAKGLTDISLPPLNEIIQDLISVRSKVIHNTYSPKVEVYSQKFKKSHHKAQSNSAENEL